MTGYVVRRAAHPPVVLQLPNDVVAFNLAGDALRDSLDARLGAR